MIDRRAFLSGIAATAISAAPGVARAQQASKTHRIGFLSLRSGPDESTEALREQLRELGYVEGRTLTIEYRWAEGKVERLPELAAELVRLKVDVIVTPATVTVAAARRATSTIPIVMAAASDPVGSGLVASLARPGGNVTGMALLTTELAGKRLQLLREVVPKATRVAVLVYPGSAATHFVAQTQAAAQQMGITLVVREVSAAEALEGAFVALGRGRAQALIVQLTPFANEHRKRIAELAAQRRLPAMFEARGFVDAGGLMSYGPSIPEMHRRAALYVDRILRGAKPADLPVEQSTRLKLVINLKTATALGLTVPESVLVRADEVIQ